MICFAQATVDECISCRQGLQVLAVTLQDGRQAKAHHYTDLGVLQPGAKVILNTTAVALGLGSGGYHYVHSIIDNGAGVNDGDRLAGVEGEGAQSAGIKSVSDDVTVGHDVIAGHDVNAGHEVGVDHDANASHIATEGHLMKLRYTSLQRAVLAVEEPASPYHELFKQSLDLQGLPVLIGELHSMLPMAVAWLRHKASERMDGRTFRSESLSIVYIATDGGALPLALSNHVAALCELGWLQGTITYGHAYGGHLEALNKFTALLAAKHCFHADLAIVCMGPGIAGTGTRLGHTAVEVGELINAVSMLQGRPIVIPRLSEAESRTRHQGLSHHTLISLSTIALRQAELPLPHISSAQLRERLSKQVSEASLHEKHHTTWHHPPSIDEIRASLQNYPLELTSMGRTIEDDPIYYQGICIAAEQAI